VDPNQKTSVQKNQYGFKEQVPGSQSFNIIKLYTYFLKFLYIFDKRKGRIHIRTQIRTNRIMNQDPGGELISDPHNTLESIVRKVRQPDITGTVSRDGYVF
jgi:hypothetical protein